MRRTTVTASVLGLVAGLLLATGSPASAAGAAGAAGVADYGFLPAQVLGVPGGPTIAVGMPDERTVRVQRLDPTTGAWSEPTTLYSRPGVTCGKIEGRASAGGVALLVQCDTPYYDDQAPVHSVGLVTLDEIGWATRRLPGEAYGAPAISPTARFAAWPLAQGDGRSDGYLEWSATAGFLAPAATTYEAGGLGEAALVVDDAGTVSVVGAERHRRSGHRSCRLAVHARTLAGADSRQVVAGIDPGCRDGSVVGLDADHVVGDDQARSTRYAVSRTAPGGPWLLSAPRPVDGAGLVDYGHRLRRVIPLQFSDVVGGPLLAVGSPDRQRVTVQAYDDATHAWSAPRTVYDHGFAGCASLPTYGVRPAAVSRVALHCYTHPRADGDYPPTDPRGYTALPEHRVTLLLSGDASTWSAVDLRDRAYGVSADGGTVAAPGPASTTIVSAAGSTVLPQGPDGPCDIVFPTGAASLLRLHARRGETWPTRLQLSTATGWRTVDRVRMPRRGPCRHAVTLGDVTPTQYVVRGPRASRLLTFRPGGPDGWRVVRNPR